MPFYFAQALNRLNDDHMDYKNRLLYLVCWYKCNISWKHFLHFTQKQLLTRYQGIPRPTKLICKINHHIIEFNKMNFTVFICTHDFALGLYDTDISIPYCITLIQISRLCNFHLNTQCTKIFLNEILFEYNSIFGN